MGALKDIPGLVVTIDVNGVDLAEYPDLDVEDPKPDASHTCVEATSGAQFGVAVRFDKNEFEDVGDDIKMVLFVDGRRIRSKTFSADGLYSRRRRVVNSRQSSRGDHYVVQKFIFAELQISKLANA